MESCKLVQSEIRIVITDPALSEYSGEEWIVTKEPLCGRFFGPHGPDVIWVGPESGPNWPDPKVRIFLSPDQYKIVDRMLN